MFADVINSAEPCGHNAVVGITIRLRARLKNNWALPIPPMSTKSVLTLLRWADPRQSQQAPWSMCPPPTLIQKISAQHVHPVLQPSPVAPSCRMPGPTVGRLMRKAWVGFKATDLLNFPSPEKCVAPVSDYKHTWSRKWNPVWTSVMKYGPTLFWRFKSALPAQIQYCFPWETHC